MLKYDVLRELLNKNWMTHDAMWFVECLKENGIEKTNRMNRTAIQSMAAIEVKRLVKTLGIQSVDSFGDAKKLLEEGFEIIKGSFMKFELSFPELNLFRWDIPSCFAFDGISALGAIDRYECGIVDRPNTWLNSLGIKYSVSPSDQRCLMHHHGKCSRVYRFHFS